MFRTDVKQRYASIDHACLMTQVRALVRGRQVVALIEHCLGHGGRRGLRAAHDQAGNSFGCALSPLLGAIYLHELDEAMARIGLFYARYMDDWVVLAPTPWKLETSQGDPDGESRDGEAECGSIRTRRISGTWRGGLISWGIGLALSWPPRG